jgi:hypothetical protein
LETLNYSDRTGRGRRRKKFPLGACRRETASLLHASNIQPLRTRSAEEIGSLPPPARLCARGTPSRQWFGRPERPGDSGFP